MFDSHVRLLIQINGFRKILIILINDSNDSNHSSQFTVLAVAAFTKKEERKTQRQQAKQTHKLLLSTAVVFVCESYLFCDSCTTTSCILLSMSTMSTSNFEYK